MGEGNADDTSGTASENEDELFVEGLGAGETPAGGVTTMKLGEEGRDAEPPSEGGRESEEDS